MRPLLRLTLALVLLSPLAACEGSDPLRPETSGTETTPAPSLIGSQGGRTSGSGGTSG